MGVKGLWRLLLPIGRRISIETLEGKVLAIDASIWMTQCLKAMRDPESGSTKPAAHLIGFFRRLAKLRYHGVRPVLVFDGKTPEIKQREVQRRRQRREQFAPTNQQSMQRLAKKLLLQQLKKSSAKKTSGGGGAFAPGFQPAEEDDQVHVAAKTSVEQPSQEKDNDKNPVAATVNNTNDSHEAIMAEVAGLEEQWAIQASLETENDFDNAVIDLTTSQRKSDEAQESIYHHTTDVFDVKRISSLPSHERKDAVEEAKRQQRMRSRREFMPVAGQPQEYSQVQLKNFLRSSRLNKEIDEMAKNAAGNDNDGIGERMASDATRRIVLTKQGEQSQSPFKRLQKRTSAFRMTKLPPEEDDDEEFEWDDGETPKSSSVNGTKNMSSSINGVATRRRNAGAPFVETVDSGDDDAPDGGGGFLPSKKKSTASVKPAPVIHIDSDESGDDAGGGGFVSPSTASKPAPVIHVDSDESNESGAGGFMTVKDITKSVSNSKAATERRGRLSDESASKRAQELEDEMLARALQEAESEPIDSASHARDRRNRQEASEQRLQVDRDAELAARLQLAYDAPEDGLESDDNDSDDAIDWEDGDQDTSLRSDDESDKKMPAVVRPTAPLADPRQSQSQAEANEESDSDDVAWEDGDDDEGTDTTLKASNARQVLHEPPIGDSVETLPAKRQASALLLNGSTNGNKNQSWDEEDAIDKPVGVGRSDFDNVQVVDQNAEALEHAQETASHLTNWAGRAFRRAMAQHAEETGTGSPEKQAHDDAMAETKAPPPAQKSNRDDDAAVRPEILEVETQQSPIPSPSSKARSTESSATPSRPPANSHVASRGGSSVAPTQSFGGFLNDATVSLQEQVDLFDAESRRQERDMDTVTDEMKAEVIQLIQLFGIPYVESPAEAEAQCAKLEELGLVDGVVTEDSDVFVFGGKSVYKNIFDDQKYVEAYLASDAQRDLGLNRNQFVALAMLLGGDYSEGVKGVGIVNGMEVLQAFDCSDSVKEGMSKFRAWLDGFDPEDARNTKEESGKQLSAEQKFRRKHKSARTQWIAPKNFPADNVMNAYLKPVVDASNDQFSWGAPDLARLLLFCERNMGWQQSETRKLLDPVMERLEDTSRQTRLESYFMKYEDDIKFANVKSKRLRAVFEDIQKDQSSEDKQAQKKRARTSST